MSIALASVPFTAKLPLLDGWINRSSSDADLTVHSAYSLEQSRSLVTRLSLVWPDVTPADAVVFEVQNDTARNDPPNALASKV